MVLGKCKLQNAFLNGMSGTEHNARELVSRKGLRTNRAGEMTGQINCSNLK